MTQKLQKQAQELTARMTLEEKASLCSGKNFWESKAVERLGVKSFMLTDGPHGLRKQAWASDHLGLNTSVPATPGIRERVPAKSTPPGSPACGMR